MKNLINQTLKSMAVACLLFNINPFETETVKADQPVHCLREQLFGVWNFHVSKDQGKINLFETNEVCSHNIPNKVQLVNQAHLFKFGTEDIYRVNIMENYKAEAVFCANDKKCSEKVIPGKWTSIYDQAMNVELDNGMRFVANLRYNLKPELAKDPYTTAQEKGIGRFSQIQSGDNEKFNSQCDKTMVGFVQNIPSITGQSYTMAEHAVQCFHAVQEKAYKVEDTKEYNTGKVKFNKITAHHDIKKEQIAGEVPSNLENGIAEAPKPKLVQRKKQKRQNLHLSHRPSDEMDLMITEVNEADLGWKADVCKYQKHHALYGSHCPLLLAQTSDNNLEVSDDQVLADTKKFGDKKDPKFVAALEKVQKYMKSHKNSQDIEENELPDTLDFRNIDGYDFTAAFRDQGHCGSCYTISMTQVMEARMKVKYGVEAPMLSPQALLTCNYMNEGCEGGWPHFNVFLGENGSLVSEECAPYKGSTKEDKCSNYSKCEPISKINKSYLVGGGWGATTEKKMMKELLRNGPMNGDFQAPSTFSIYKEGIFSEKGLIDVHNKANAKISALSEQGYDKDFINTIAELKLDSIFEAQTGSSTDDKSDEKVGAEKHHHKKPSTPKLTQNKSKKTSKFSDVSLNDKGISWMDMNHSVVIIGWGKEEKTDTRYWIVRNSYGPKWGMDGDFLVKRGNNDFGMEVEQIAFEPHWFAQETSQASE